jgi:hypothetical protein
MLEVGRVAVGGQPDLPHEERAVARALAQRGERLTDPGLVGGEAVLERLVRGMAGHDVRAERGRVVAQLGVLEELLQRVEAKAGDALSAPEREHAGQLLRHLRTAPVEVGLLGVEGVQVPAAPVGIT